MRSNGVRREREVRRREGYRETILHAAERVILRKGYSALTMDDVAREAQLSKATVYKYVTGKGALLFEIMGHAFDDVRDRFAAVLAGPGTAAQKLGRLIQVVLQSNEDMNKVNRVLWMDKAMLSRLENGRVANPGIETISRYLDALDKVIAWRVADASPKTRSARPHVGRT